MDDTTAGTGSSTTWIDEDLDFDLDLDLGEDEPDHDGASGSRRMRMPRRKAGGYRPVRMRSTPNWTRIAAAGFIAAVVLALLVLSISAFVGHRRESAWKSYFSNVREVVNQSNTQGDELQVLLTQPTGADRAQLVGRVDRLARRSDQLVAQAKGIESPEELTGAHEWLVTTLVYRRNGLHALEKSMTAALGMKDKKAAAALIADANQRLVASDVIFADSWAASARKILSREQIEGIKVPESEFVKDPELGSPKAMQLMLDRIATVGSTAAKNGKKVKVKGVQGTSLGSVSVSPAGTVLSATGINEIAGSDDLAFEVVVENGGESQQTRIPVTVTLRGDNTDTQKLTAYIEKVDPGQSASVTIPMDEIPTFGEVLTAKVAVSPVAGEKLTTNNNGTYEVLFKL